MPGFSQANQLESWQALAQHHKELSKDIVLRDYFANDPKRFEKFTRTFNNEADGSEILFDFSKNFITEETLKLLINLAKEVKLEELRDDMFKGDKINFTEKRAVLHVALRNTENWPISVDGKSVVEGVNETLDHMKKFSEQVRSGEWKGYSGKAIDTIINIGIGGSDLYVYDLISFFLTQPLTDDLIVDPSWSPKLSSHMARRATNYTSSRTLTAPTSQRPSSTQTQRLPCS
jgi:glucose-6-phosphate isomerase